MTYEKELKSGEVAKILHIKNFEWRIPVTDARPAPPLVNGGLYQYIDIGQHYYIFFDKPLLLSESPVPVVGIRAPKLIENNRSWVIEAEEVNDELIISKDFQDDQVKKVGALMGRNCSSLALYIKKSKTEFDFICPIDDFLDDDGNLFPNIPQPVPPTPDHEKVIIHIAEHLDKIRDIENGPYNEFLMFYPYQAEPLIKFLNHMNNNQSHGAEGLDYPISMILEGIATKEETGASVNLHVMLDALQDYMYALKQNKEPKEHLLHKIINYALLEIYRNDEESN